MSSFFTKIFKNYISRYIPNKIKIILSKKITGILFSLRNSTSIYFFDKFLISLCFKSNEFEKVKKIITNHKNNVQYAYFLEKVLRYEALEYDTYGNAIERDRMLCFNQLKYDGLIKENIQLSKNFPDDHFIHDRLARNYVAGGYIKKAKFHFSESLKLQRKEKILKGQPGLIVLASMNRAGTTFVSNSIVDGLKLKLVNMPYHDVFYPDYTMIHLPSYATHWKFLPMPDGFWNGHIPATEPNLLCLSLVTDKIIVNFRDPRQQLISFIHHLEYLRAKGEFFGVIQYQTPEEYFTWSLEKKLDWQIENGCVPSSIKWIEGWMKAAKDPQFHCEVLFCQQNTLAQNPKKYFEDILSFYGIPENKFKYPSNPKFKGKSFSLRSGQTDEWKKVLKTEQIKKIENLIPESWFQQFNWDRAI